MDKQQKRADRLDDEHEPDSAGHHQGNLFGVVQPQRAGHRQPLTECDLAADQAEDQNDDDDQAHTTDLHQQHQDELTPDGQFRADRNKAQAGHGRG